MRFVANGGSGGGSVVAKTRFKELYYQAMINVLL